MAIKVAETVVKQVDIPPAAPAPGSETAFYKLRAAYWDGRKEHPIDSILEFEKGKQPKSAVLQEGYAPELAEPTVTENDED